MKSLHEEVRQAAVSKAVLEALEERFDAIESNLHITWAKSTVKDAELREKAYLQLNALQQLRRSFEVDVETGKMASIQLEEDLKKAS